jgi:uncharacterized protein (UPF0264 family)
MTRLLVSVRSAPEALTALAGGANIIDVKEPSRGSLGRAEDATLAEVVRMVAGRRPVSAAMGELIDAEPTSPPSGLTFVKYGLAGCATHDWRGWLRAQERQLSSFHPDCALVPVAYADWRRAAAPAVEEVVAFAIEHPGGVLLLDTWDKDGTTLLDWLSLVEVARLGETAHRASARVALAGSLGLEEIARLLPARPDWIAVRGAVCRGRDRNAAIDEERVRQLDALLRPRSG